MTGSLRRSAAEAFVIGCGSLFFLLLAATIGLPGENTKPGKTRQALVLAEAAQESSHSPVPRPYFNWGHAARPGSR